MACPLAPILKTLFHGTAGACTRPLRGKALGQAVRLLSQFAVVGARFGVRVMLDAPRWGFPVRLSGNTSFCPVLSAGVHSTRRRVSEPNSQCDFRILLKLSQDRRRAFATLSIRSGSRFHRWRRAFFVFDEQQAGKCWLGARLFSYSERTFFVLSVLKKSCALPPATFPGK